MVMDNYLLAHPRSHAMRKKKHRVVNLRKSKTTDDVTSESGDSETSNAAAASEPAFPARIPEEPEDNIIIPPRSPGRVRFQNSSIDLGDSPRKLRLSTSGRPNINLSSRTLPEQAILDPTPTIEKDEPTAPIFGRERRPSFKANRYPEEKASNSASAAANATVPISHSPHLAPAPVLSTAPGILEQAWVLKMAGEIARRVHDEKAAREGFWSSQSTDEREDSPPPAYQAKAM